MSHRQSDRRAIPVDGDLPAKDRIMKSEGEKGYSLADYTPDELREMDGLPRSFGRCKRRWGKAVCLFTYVKLAVTLCVTVWDLLRRKA